MIVAKLPTLAELGSDVIRVPRWRLMVSLTTPFALVCGYFCFANSGWWVLAVSCVIILSFVTYGSVSHDLVHRSLGLSRWLNDLFLCAIELLLLRSGRAYRLAHLNHHAHYPDPNDDPEAVAAHGSLWRAFRHGPLFFITLWWWAIRRHPAHRTRLFFEAAAISGLSIGAIVYAIVGWSDVPVVYFLLVYLGTWVVPLTTAYIPHNPRGDNPLSQTRRFRGWALRIIAFDHLYHLEHHLYPAVPHIHWAELARRLDPYLDRAGIPSFRLGP
jgi:beta-carotene hydroxylase